MNYRIEEADDMPLERWTAYMWSHLLTLGLSKTHFLTKDKDGKSWIKQKKVSKIIKNHESKISTRRESNPTTD